MSSMTRVMMMGGFDGERGDFADRIEEYSLRTNGWLPGNRVLNKGKYCTPCKMQWGNLRLLQRV